MTDTQKTLTAEAEIATASARRYLGQLCKHFAHKIPATWTDNFDVGRIEFEAGACDLSAASPDRLVLRCSAGSAESLARIENVIASHLERFAFRETLQIAWSDAGAPAQGDA